MKTSGTTVNRMRTTFVTDSFMTDPWGHPVVCDRTRRDVCSTSLPAGRVALWQLDVLEIERHGDLLLADEDVNPEG